MASNVLDVGMLVAEKYQILESLGKGGMANVWLARDERLGKLWAIKEIKPNASGSRGEALRQAIIDEANFMKRLDHPAIPRVVDIIDTGGTIFVIMDYVDGRSLGDLLRLRERPFEQADVIAWGLLLCDVLDYLHHCDPPIVYRDMKPANVMLRDDGTVRLIDFGIAMECVPDRNNDGRVVGTPGYAPPEQLPYPMPWPPPNHLDPDRLIDARSDVYALGTTLYTLVTGQVPQRADDVQGHPQVDFAMRPIRSWNPRLSEGLERIILRATAPDANDRYQNVAEMRYDLAHHEELTEVWRATRKRTLHRWHALMGGALALAVLGVVCLTLGSALRQSDYAALMHEAEVASRASVDEQPSEAERLYTQALELDPTNLEPYRRLLEVYEDDYRFSDGEAHRWQRAYGKAHDLSRAAGFAQLCFDVGTCYLCYYGIEVGGGSVGNAAIASMSAAAPWYRRALEADEQSDARPLNDDQRRAAQLYEVIAGFHEQVVRLGKEGRDASEQFRSFWQVLEDAVARENAAGDARRSPEGVRVRLCQVSVEVVASSTYLASMARAGITSQQAQRLLAGVRTCLEGLQDFGRAAEYEEVYGPVFEEIRQGLLVADQNILNTFANPVVGVGAGFDVVEEEQ